jgi:hypothetical protein
LSFLNMTLDSFTEGESIRGFDSRPRLK